MVIEDTVLFFLMKKVLMCNQTRGDGDSALFDGASRGSGGGAVCERASARFNLNRNGRVLRPAAALARRASDASTATARPETHVQTNLNGLTDSATAASACVTVGAHTESNTDNTSE